MAMMGAAVGLSMLSSILQSRQQRKAAKQQRMLQEMQRQRIQALTSPEHYNQLIGNYRTQFAEGYRPAQRQLADQLALGQQTQEQSFQNDLARRGLSGSGMAFAGMNAIGAQRQAGLGQAEQNYQMDVERASREAAGQNIQNQLGGAYNTPYEYVPPGPTGLQAALSGISAGLGGAATMSGLTGSSPQNFGQLMGLKGGPTGQYGPQQPYYVGQNVGPG